MHEAVETKDRVLTESCIGGVTVYEVQTDTEPVASEFDAHMLAIGDAPTDSHDIWEGRRLLNRWHGKTAGFLPARTRLISTPTAGFRGAVMLIPTALLAADALRFGTIESDALRQVAQAVRVLAATEEFAQVPLLAESAATTLASVLAATLAPSSLCGPKVGLGDERRRRVLDFIEAHLHEPLGLSQLADVAALSQFHFTRSFRATTGMSPLRYVSARRVERAKHLLRASSLPLVDVALRCGFCSQAYMTTVFRKATGVSPGEYRRAFAEFPGRCAAMVLQTG